MGQQIAFIIVILLCGMIFTQILLFRNDFEKKYNALLKRISEIEGMLSKNEAIDKKEIQ
jgi:hypothetical protein